jgi:PKD repeat protein
MQSTISVRSFVPRAAVALLALGAISCGLDKQTAPSLTGPSEFATSLTVSASPEVVNRDGASQSVITISTRNPENGPMSGRIVRLGLDPVIGGTLSSYEVTTNSNGTATVVYTAPSIDTPIDAVRVLAVPAETNFDNATARNVLIALSGPAAADADFTFSPDLPQQFQTVAFDASNTRVEGQVCNGSCTYNWDFGGENTATGMVVSYRFQREQTYVVTLRVTSPGGMTTTARQTVVVSAATGPTAVITVSPTAPRAAQSVFFSGAGSTAVGGATISEYTWEFGNGTSGTGATPTVTYAAPGTYVVRLTVRDSNGMTGTATSNVTIAP